MSVRPCQYRDLESIESLVEHSSNGFETESRGYSLLGVSKDVQSMRRWYGPLKLLSLFPNPMRHFFHAYVAELDGQAQGVIQVAPFNRTRTTWRIERVAAASHLPTASPSSNGDGRSGNGDIKGKGQTVDAMLSADVASHLLRHCLESIWEARVWLVEVGVEDQDGLGLYRQHGFQPLAQITYWAIAPDLLKVLASREATLPNLRPVSNSDAPLLHQLDTVAMPPLVRQVFDRHVSDFKSGVARSTVDALGRLIRHHEVTSGYVFEPQRKAAIGYFRLHMSQDGNLPHQAHLTVHPAYTWLYPEMLSHMAGLLKGYPDQILQIASSDYQPEREEYLQKFGAERVEHTLMMSRSVWHKIREAKPASMEGLQLAEVLQGLKPSRKAVPGRFSWMPPLQSMPPSHSDAGDSAHEQKANFQNASPSQSSLSEPSHQRDSLKSDLHDSSDWPKNGAT